MITRIPKMFVMVYVFHNTKLWSKHRPNRGRTNEVLRCSTAAAAAVKDRSSWAVTAVAAVATVSRGLHAIARARTYIHIYVYVVDESLNANGRERIVRHVIDNPIKREIIERAGNVCIHVKSSIRPVFSV